MTISIRFNNNNEISNVFTKANFIDNSFNRVCNINENKLFDDRKRWKFKTNNYNVVDCKFNWCIWEINSFNCINEIKNFIRNANDWWCEFDQSDLEWYNEQCLNTKIENDKQDRRKKNKLKFSRLVEQISRWCEDNDVSIVSIARMRKKRRDDYHLSKLSFNRVDTNFNEDLRCSNIRMKNYSSLLKFVKKIENLIKTFIFKLIRICEWDEKLNKSIDSNHMTIKFSITTTTRYWWINDLEYKDYLRNW